jgi:hypothetical protein
MYKTVVEWLPSMCEVWDLIPSKHICTKKPSEFETFSYIYEYIFIHIYVYVYVHMFENCFSLCC